MFRRAVILPAGPRSVWRAVTDPAALADWFGARVEWDLRPGGRASFRPSSGGGDREGVIDAVEPGRTLRFRWWPVDGDGDVSEVVYELEPDEQGTTLTVTERRLPAPARTTSASAAPAATASAAWTPADQVSWERWAATAGRPARIGAVGIRGVGDAH